MTEEVKTESNGQRVKVPSGATEFEMPDGTVFQLNVLEAHNGFRDIAKEHQNDPDQRAYLNAIIGYVIEKAGVTLNMDQANWLQLETENVMLKKNQQQVESIRNIARSLYSTGSTSSS